MAWTYDGDPSANARDAIRFLIGDTDTNDQLLADAEVAWVNSQVTGSDTATTGLYDAAYRWDIVTQPVGSISPRFILNHPSIGVQIIYARLDYLTPY